MSESYFEVDEMKYESNVYKSDNILKKYKEDNKLNYPLIYLKIDAIELFRVDALKGMLKKETILGDDDVINVYLDFQGTLMHLGLLDMLLLRSFLDNPVFKTWEKCIYTGPEMCYSDVMMYALCRPNVEY